MLVSAFEIRGNEGGRPSWALSGAQREQRLSPQPPNATSKVAISNDRLTCAPCQGGAFQWVQAPPGNRSSRKQPEQSWRQQNGWSLRCSRSHIGDGASVRGAR